MRTFSPSKHLSQQRSNPQILIGVSASVSAYKSTDLIRRLREGGANTQVIPTSASLNFVGSALWEALSGNAVHSELWSNVQHSPHIELARSADLLVIAPASANIIAKCSAGVADDLLTNIFLATNAPVIFVPAMHSQMWNSPSNQFNVELLRSRGFTVLEPGVGALTSGDSGIGRYPELSYILDEINFVLHQSEFLSGKKITITAGGTREAIDAVRYIGNRSSGKQGLALAKAALAYGAQVTLITTANTPFTHPRLSVKSVESAQEMLTAVQQSEFADAYIFAAAVADAKPAITHQDKLHKEAYSHIDLIPTVDIAAKIGHEKNPETKILIFAAETGEAARESAHAKLLRKGANLIYMNRVDNGAVFGEENSQGVIIFESGESLEVTTRSKYQVAQLLLANLFGFPLPTK